MFFGALLSAILSTASGALLAPTAIFTENVLRPFVPHMPDRQFLLTLRLVLVTFTAGALLFALNSKSTMYEMVQNAYNVTLAGAFIPLVAGAYWNRANTQGALLSIIWASAPGWAPPPWRRRPWCRPTCWGWRRRRWACCWDRWRRAWCRTGACRSRRRSAMRSPHSSRRRPPRQRASALSHRSARPDCGWCRRRLAPATYN
jgi:hypothetical protein